MAFILRRVIPFLRRYRPAIFSATASIATLGFVSSKIPIRKLYAAPDKPTVKPSLILGAVVEEEDPQSAKGLKIVVIKPESLAEKHGLKEDDIILEIDGMTVKSLEQYKKAVSIYNEKGKKFKILRGSETIVIQITF